MKFMRHLAANLIFGHPFEKTNFVGKSVTQMLVNLPERRFRRRSFRIRNEGENVREKLTSRCQHMPYVYKRPVVVEFATSVYTYDSSDVSRHAEVT
jgi:hypothetical protein